MLIEFILIILLLIFFSFWFQIKPKNFPPGPIGFPLLGCIPILGKYIHKALKEMGNKYGPIFSISLGNFKCVVLDDPQIIKDALKELNFSGRPLFDLLLSRGNGENKGIILSNGEEWNQNRRFTLRHLRDFGFGRVSMESLIQLELADLVELVGKQKGPISTSKLFNASTLNVLWAIVAGERFKLDDPTLYEANHKLSEAVKVSLGIHMFLPWLNKISPSLSGLNYSTDANIAIIEFVQKHLEEHKKSHILNEPRDFIDVYLDMIESTTDEKSVFYGDGGFKSAVFSVFDLFVAGAETTATTLQWTFLYMAVFQDKQKKLQNEIDKVIGNSRLPNLSDRTSMPYAEATINEILRYSSIVALSVFHKTTENVQFHGFTIPKDTWIIPNLYSIHHSEKIWGDPEQFRPERFLSKDEKTFVKNDALLAFSIGKRSCIGEILARDELFIFITGLLQRFSVSPDESNLFPNYKDSYSSSVLLPREHLLSIKPRIN